MNTNRNSNENFNEIVFENKNKAYGAYAIRKSYSDNVTISLMLSSAFFGILALLAVVLTKKDIEIPIMSCGNSLDFKITEMFTPPVDKPIVEPLKKDPSTPATTSGHLAASDNPEDKLDKTNTEQIISKNPNPFADSGSVADPDIIVVRKIAPAPAVIVTIADKMPKLDNMAQFIADNLKYPRVAIENGTTGVVYVTFVVEKDGSVTDVKLLKGIGDGCEQEAMRVVRNFPKWEPGVTKGENQRVQCNLPVHFRIK
ncbi:MAG TPA: TonB family protein [Bacteroidia bacterium]|jgi:protein TonB